MATCARYEAKKAGNEGDARRVVVAVMGGMRAVVLYHVGVRNKESDPWRSFMGEHSGFGVRACLDRDRRRDAARVGGSGVEVRGDEPSK